jgi:putative membrane protein
MNIFIRIIIQTAAVFVAASILPGVEVDSIVTTLIVAIVLGVINVFLKPLLILLTLPITVVTFGLFIFVINALLVLLVSNLVNGFSVNGFWWALLFSIIVSLVSSFLESLNK